MSAPHHAATALESQIRSQPEVLQQVIDDPDTRRQVHAAAEGLHRVHRIWLVGTGTSLHAAELGATMLAEAGRTAQAVSSMHFVEWAPPVGPRDGVIVITHTGETAYARSARSQAFTGGLAVYAITRQGGNLPDSIETIPKEPSETYTASYTATLAVLAMLAGALGAQNYGEEALAAVPGAVQAALDAPGIDDIAAPQRLLVLTGAGPASVTAREGALKAREAARFLAEGFDAEYLLHGNAVPLTTQDRILALTTPDPGGFVGRLSDVAASAGIAVSRLAEPSPLGPTLAQIPLTVRLQLLALRLAGERGQDPDTVIVPPWDDEALWRIGAP